MSEISLRQQIEQITILKDYIRLSEYEVEKLNSEMRQWLSYLRKDGLTQEFADQFEGHLYMEHVYAQLDDLLTRMREEDERYLNEVIEKLNSMRD